MLRVFRAPYRDVEPGCHPPMLHCGEGGVVVTLGRDPRVSGGGRCSGRVCLGKVSDGGWEPIGLHAATCIDGRTFQVAAAQNVCEFSHCCCSRNMEFISAAQRGHTLQADFNLLKHLGIAEYALETAIQVGSLWVRPKELQVHLGRYAQRFVNCNDDEVYQFQHIGSATGIKHRGRYFVISTDHQRKLGTVGQLGIVCDPGQSVITPSLMWTVETPGQDEREDNHDFVIFEFEPAKYPNRTLTSQFFEVGQNSGVAASVGKIALNLGYPTRLQNVDYYMGEVDLLVVSSFVELVEKTTSEDVYIFRTVAEDRFIEDGMSGSPIFEVVRDNGVFRVKWLGIVVRGGKQSRHGRVISADYIIRQIDRVAFS